MPPPWLKSPQKRKLRLLALHGGGCNTSIMQFQMRALMSSLCDDQAVELVHVEGPYVSDENGPEDMRPLVIIDPRNDEKHWFTYVDPTVAKACPNETYKYWFQVQLHHDPPHPPVGYLADSIKRGVEHVVSQLPGLGEIDGIVGFSQGSNMAVVLTAMYETGRLPALKGLKMCLLFAPSNFGWSNNFSELLGIPAGNKLLFDAPLMTPAMIITGDQDPGLDRSLATAPLFQNVKHRTFPGGHTIPTEAAEHQNAVQLARQFVLQTHQLYI